MYFPWCIITVRLCSSQFWKSLQGKRCIWTILMSLCSEQSVENTPDVCCLLNKLLRQVSEGVSPVTRLPSSPSFMKSQLYKHSWKICQFRTFQTQWWVVSAASRWSKMFKFFSWRSWPSPHTHDLFHWALSACCGSLEDADPEFVISMSLEASTAPRAQECFCECRLMFSC